MIELADIEPDILRLTITGCGSSPGVPRIMGDWGNCNPTNPKNRRLRAAAIFQRIKSDGRKTNIAVDTGPDFRQQMINANVIKLDAVVYTHEHADHIHGIDDLRGYVLHQRSRIPIFAGELTMKRLKEGFAYCFETPPGSGYPPIVKPETVKAGDVITVEGEGGSIAFEPLYQIHGDGYSLGYRVGDFAYCTDVSGFPDETVDRLQGLDCLVIDALQYKSHPSHFSLGEALDWIDRLKPRQALLTHMHTPLDYEAVLRETPDNVFPCYDGIYVEKTFLNH